MKPPFLFENIFTTSLSKKDITNHIVKLSKIEEKLWIIKKHPFKINKDGDTFKIQKKYHRERGPSYPLVFVEFIAENPSLIRIKIVPKYFTILFFMIFPIVFLPLSILSETMKINGVLRAPELWERLIFGGFGGILPLVWCYFDCIVPIETMKKWIKDELLLHEIS